MTNEILSEVGDGIATLTLNRPQRINAVNRAMVDQMSDILHAWADDDRVQQVRLAGAGERGFCAGARCARAADSIVAGPSHQALDFLYAEYEMERYIAYYPKPVTSYLSGIAMGAGLGIGLHNTTSIGQPGTRWAMPETAIGLWPDVGVCYELSRAPGRIGEYLAMSGQTIDGLSAHWAGAAGRMPWRLTTRHRRRWQPRLAGSMSASPVRMPAKSSLRWSCIRNKDARGAAETIRARSPLSVCVALRAVRNARAMAEIGDVFDQDGKLATTFMADPADFVEGVRAKMVDNGRQPALAARSHRDVDPAEVATRFMTEI
jgi:enoyl-CoA hydratase